MTIGYPGRTQRYMSSWGIQQMVESENKPRIEVRGVKQEIWWNDMTKSDETRIKYASKYDGSSNYWKNAIGMNEAIDHLNVIAEKKELENRLASWIESDPARKEKYGNTLNTLEEAYTNSNEIAKYTTIFWKLSKTESKLFVFPTPFCSSIQMEQSRKNRNLSTIAFLEPTKITILNSIKRCFPRL